MVVVFVELVGVLVLVFLHLLDAFMNLFLMQQKQLFLRLSTLMIFLRIILLISILLSTPSHRTFPIKRIIDLRKQFVLLAPNRTQMKWIGVLLSINLRVLQYWVLIVAINRLLWTDELPDGLPLNHVVPC